MDVDNHKTSATRMRVAGEEGAVGVAAMLSSSKKENVSNFHGGHECGTYPRDLMVSSYNPKRLVGNLSIHEEIGIVQDS